MALIDEKLKRMPYTVRVGWIAGGLSEFISIQDAVDYCDNETGDWTIEIYAGNPYDEGDITPNGGANITLKGIGTDRVVIAPTADPAVAVIVSGHTLHIEDIIVNAFSAGFPALRVTGGTLYAHRSEFYGVGAGDAIQQVDGEINLYSCYVPVGDIDLDTADCIFNFRVGEFLGTFDTAGAGISHTVELHNLTCGYQNFNLLATGGCNYDFDSLSEVGDITDESLLGTGVICLSHINGFLLKNGSSPWTIDHSTIAEINNNLAAGAITVYGGMIWLCGGATGTVLWYKDNGRLRVLENMGIQDALDAIPAGGAEIEIGEGAFPLAAQVARAIDDVRIRGAGLATRITLDGVTPVITAGVQDGWILADMDVDAGLVEIQFATNSTLDNITINGLHGTIINPDLGQTNFPGQPVVRLEEIRALDPPTTDIIKVFDKIEYQAQNPTFANPQFIMELLRRQARYMHVSINDLWTDGSTGGTSLLYPQYAELACAAAGGQDGLAHCTAAFLNSYVDATVWDRVDFDNMFIWAFDVSRGTGSHADIRARVQLKQAVAEGVLANDGMGIEIQNLSIFGEAFAGAQGTVDLGVLMTTLYTYRIAIVLIPNVSVDFYVNEVYRGQITAQVPTGPAAGTCYWVLSIDNGAVATACQLRVSPISYWNHL